MFRKVFIHAAIFTLAAALKKCDNRLCNYEAECVISRGKPTCDCIGKTFYSGEKCETKVDNCSPNPCKSGGRCISHLGQYYCECPARLGGQGCDISQDNLLKHVYVHFNRLATIQQTQNFLLTLEDLGNEPITSEFFMDDTFIDGFTYYPSNPKHKDRWKKSDNLVNVAKSLGLQHAKELPFQKGFYRVSKARFYIEGAKEVTLIFTTMKQELIYMQTFGIHVFKPESMGCVPVVEVPLCSTPKPLLHMDVAQYNTVEPKIKKRCSQSSSITYKWSVKNFAGTELLYTFKPVKHALLKIPPYGLRFDNEDEYISSYLIYGEVEEVYGSVHTRTYVRCYVFIDPKPVTAYITGGAKCTVGVSQPLVLDASKSRNFAFSPTEDQHLKYYWKCEAQESNGEVSACTNLKSTEQYVMIPGGKLILDQTYIFTLNIESTSRFNRKNTYEQEVKVQDAFALLVDIECVRNCENNKFTQGMDVHLLGVCIDCSNSVGKATYAWTQNGNAIGDKERLVYTPGNDERTEIVLVVKRGSSSGEAKYRLSKNTPPTGGDCTIKPTAGEEYITEFEIHCKGYKDEEVPIKYEYLADGNILERTGNPIVSLRLPKLDELKVKICDPQRACTDKFLSVSVKSLSVPSSVGDLEKFLTEEKFDLRALFKDGKTRESLLLADIVLKEATSEEFASKIIKQMEGYEVETLLATEQFTSITKDLVESLQPMDNRKAGVLAEFFGKLAEGYENVILDGEMKDLLKEPYELLAGSMSYMLNEFSVPLEEIQEVQALQEEQDLKNPLAEHYPDFPKFDISILSRIDNWLKAAEQLNKCINRLGFLATNMHHPGEKPYIADLPSFTMEMFGFEGGQAQEVLSNDGEVNIKLNDIVVAELQEQLGSKELVLQIVSIQKNPFWWYPDEQPLSTSVMYFSIFGKKKNLDSTIRLQNTLDFKINLRAPTATKVSTSFVESSLDMPIFDVKMPANSILVVKFLKTDIKLSVMLRLGVKPRGFMVRKSKQTVLVGKEESFVLVNDKQEASNGYLAVMAMNGEPFEKRAEFSFEFFLQECLSWDASLPDPQWTTSGCIPSQQETNATQLYCSCHHLSSFSGKVFPTSPKVAPGKLLEIMPINWYIVLFYICLTLVFGFLIWSARRNMNESQNVNLMFERTDRDEREDFDIVLLIYTGSHRHAGTTANVDISLAMRWNVFRKFTIYQNPAKSKLIQNSTCVLKLPIASNNLKKDPMQIIIQHNGYGRYASWYCHSIEVKDLETKQTAICPVGQWISTKPVHLEAPWERTHVSRYSQFKEKLVTYFINWFGFQALFGPWKYGSEPFNRSERTMIWIMKVSITICIIACYFGPTTLENYEEEREIYNRMHLDIGTIFYLSIICYMIGVLIDTILGFLVKYEYI